MKVIKSILDRPFLVILIAALILILVPLIFPIQYFFYSFIIIVLIFTISLIYTIVQKKWLRLFFSVLGFVGFFIILSIIFIYGFYDAISTKYEIGDSKFYSNEIAYSSNLHISRDLKLVSKLDSIFYVGLEREYDAECLYTGPKRSIQELERNIISQKEFTKVKQIENYPTQVLTKTNFNLKDLNSVYKKESDGHYIIYVAFDKMYSKFYYSAVYY
jgi:energy-coupling factor transporter transmembrane protein EcfT